MMESRKRLTSTSIKLAPLVSCQRAFSWHPGFLKKVLIPTKLPSHIFKYFLDATSHKKRAAGMTIRKLLSCQRAFSWHPGFSQVHSGCHLAQKTCGWHDMVLF